MGKVENRRSIRLVNPRFQLKFAFLITLLVLVSSVFIPVFVLSSIDQSLIQKEKKVKPEVLEGVRKVRNEFLSVIVVFEALVIFFAFLLALYHSHRIVGPINRLRTSMKLMRSGSWPPHVKFRKKDNFSELADEFNATLDFISQKYMSAGAASVSTKDIISQLKRVRPYLPDNEQEDLDRAIEKIGNLY